MLQRAKTNLARAKRAAGDARKTYDQTPRTENARAKGAWDAAERAVRSAEADVHRWEAEMRRANDRARSRC